jgi:hypothetical protein
MSTFTGWNGPGGCGCCGNGDWPVFKKLKELYDLIESVKVTADAAATVAYVDSKTAAAQQAAITEAQTRITAAINGVNNTIAALAARVLSAEGAISSIDAIIGTVTSVKGAIDAAIAALNLDLTAKIDLINSKLGTVPANKTIVGMLGEVSTDLSNLKNALFVDPTATNLLIKLGIVTEEDITVGRINLNQLLDFDVWNVVTTPFPSVSNSKDGQSYSVAIVGVLSDKWRDNFADKPIDVGGKIKSGRAFIKVLNTKPFNAIVDASATLKTGTDATGAISALVSKTSDREARYIVGQNPDGSDITRPAIRFGLYSGTSAEEKEYIYLGFVIEEMYTSSNPIKAYVAGINFIALNSTNTPNLGVTEITVADISEDGELGVSALSATDAIKSDHYQDRHGNSIWEIEDDGDLAIGNTNRQLILYSINRPTVEHADLSKHEIAYLTDIAQSIYWQKAVNYIDETLDTLNNRKVYFDSDGNPVAPDSPDIASNKAGVYTSNPYTGHPTYKLFEEDETGLIRDGGTKNNVLADGSYSGEFTSGSSNIPISAITGLVDSSFVKTGTNNTSVIDGTILKDKNGKYAKIIAVTGDTFTVLAFVSSPFFAYTVPAYVKYTTLFGWAIDTIIPIPETFDERITDISYEWSGLGSVLTPNGPVPLFHDTYTTWTAHHENGPDATGATKPNQTMLYTGIAWDSITIQLEGYRNALAQDKIDDALLGVATVQADYAENREVIDVQLPERDKPSRVANPAYIQHKPWTGVALVEPGSFIDPLMLEAWLLDGGDFTGLNGDTLPIGDAPQASALFRNAIIRVWRGNYADMPEIKTPSVGSVWSNFAHTLRWCIDKEELWYSDGVKLHLINGTKILYADGSWEWYETESDGGGHFYWDFTTKTLRFSGANADASSPIVWEQYAIDGGGPNFDTVGSGTKIGTRLITAWDGGAVGVGTLRTYYTVDKADSSFTADDEIFTAPALPADAATKTYILKVVNGVKTWVEDV